jgi:kynurenine formamidase
VTAAFRRTPSFADLPSLPDRDERHAWDVWGRDDEIGTLNLIGPQQRLDAAQCVRSGEIIPVTLPLNEPDPGMFLGRDPYEHVIEDIAVGHDDRVDNFYLQFSSQWDGLRHVRAGKHGYWGGRQEDDLVGNVLGIDRWAERGVAGRGVLIDVAGHAARHGGAIDPTEPFEISGELIDDVAAAEGVALRSGDILLIRTGWIEYYRALPDSQRAALRGSVGHGFCCPGLEPSQATAAYLWDHEIAAVAVDNVGVEVFPVGREKGFLHRRLIPLQGMAIGELWSFQRLAAVCSATGHYDCLLVSGLLNIPGGVGSPANAYAMV